MSKVKQGTIKELKFDPQNANRGTERGNQALEESLQRYGAGRSVLADKNGVIIAGNKTVEKAGEIGIEDAVFVHTKGDQVVVVVRDDLDLAADPEARALAIADNRVGELDLAWDISALVDSAKDLETLEPFFYQQEIDELLAAFNQEEKGDTGFRPDSGFHKPQDETGESFFLTEEQKREYDHIEHITVDFSGGRDSTLALLWAKTTFPDRHIVAIFSDPGVEFPAMSVHVQEVCDFLGVEYVIVKPKADWWTWLNKKGCWPSLLYRDCQGPFIHDPVNAVKVGLPMETTLILDGSRATQMVRGSKKNKTTPHNSHPKLKNYKTYHPCFDLTDEAAYDLLEKSKVPLWRGYAMGFQRTACWCCPGMCGLQAYALEKNFPGLANEIRFWEKRIGFMQSMNNKGFDDLVRVGAKKAEKEGLL